MAESNFDPNSITLEEARNALADPEKGSLRVLKTLGKYRDQFAAKLYTGAYVLEVNSDLEQVAAEAALRDYASELAEDGEAPPKVSILRPRAAFK
ncbi:MAG: hypothetical protein LBS44_00710 [Deltaproteobacteria bacterium]|jgi:hypothetical protein|nr:hypothetical protein [Deltaproteobacteria bacterium]